jgi:hypothetical protein
MRKLKALCVLLLNNLPSRQHALFWITGALLLKSLFFIYKVSWEDHRPVNPHYTQTIACESGDAASYIEPVENYIRTGHYDSPEYGDFRMPGYGLLYFTLRQFLPLNAALNALVIIQLMLSALSVYVLALLAYEVFKKKKAFVLTYALYGWSVFVSLYDPLIGSESLCTSLLIFSTYLLLTPEKTFGRLLASGILLSWAVFTRPVLAPLFLPFSIYLGLRCRSGHVDVNVRMVKRISFFLIPFFLMDGVWIIRNWQVHHRIIPLTTSYYYPKVEKTYQASLFKFMNSFGGSLIWWEPGAEIAFFIPPPKSLRVKKQAVLPDYIYTSKFNYDSLVVVKKMIERVDEVSIGKQETEELTQQISRKLDSYTASVKLEHPFLYYIGSRFRSFRTFFVHPGTYNLFTRASFELRGYEMLLKLMYSLLYVWVVVGGFLGAFLLFRKGFFCYEYLLISVLALYFAFIFPLGLKMDEYRYFVPGYPFFILAMVYTILELGEWFSWRRSKREQKRQIQ